MAHLARAGRLLGGNDSYASCFREKSAGDNPLRVARISRIMLHAWSKGLGPFGRGASSNLLRWSDEQASPRLPLSSVRPSVAAEQKTILNALFSCIRAAVAQ